jgi:membrane protease YdiL (CAAX protease family)
MKKQPLIKQGWLRVLLFIICLLVIILLLTRASTFIINALQISENRAGEPESAQANLQGSSMLITFLASFLASLSTVFIFLRLVDRRSFTSLGLEWNNNQSHAGTGFFLGIFLLCIGSFVLIGNDNLNWTDIRFSIDGLFIGLGLMLLVAFAEEIVFRGYVLHNLLPSMNKWIALTLSALIFALFHVNNPGVTPMALVNIFLGGLILGINYIYTKNLWFSILFHFSWNFLEGPVLGYKVSGLNLQSLLEQELSGSTIITGGNFGFEASLLNGSLIVIATLILAWIYERKFSVRAAIG